VIEHVHIVENLAFMADAESVGIKVCRAEAEKILGRDFSASVLLKLSKKS
jgi:hypothetical protein